MHVLVLLLRRADLAFVVPVHIRYVDWCYTFLRVSSSTAAAATPPLHYVYCVIGLAFGPGLKVLLVEVVPWGANALACPVMADACLQIADCALPQGWMWVCPAAVPPQTLRRLGSCKRNCVASAIMSHTKLAMVLVGRSPPFIRCTNSNSCLILVTSSKW